MPRVNKTVFVCWKSIKNMDCVQQIFPSILLKKSKKKRQLKVLQWCFIAHCTNTSSDGGCRGGVVSIAFIAILEMPLHDLNREK